MVLSAKGEDVKMDICPLPEQMALLVEGKIKGEDKKQILAHLSRCETCFEEWFNISEARKENKHTSLLHLNRRFLSYAGPALPFLPFHMKVKVSRKSSSRRADGAYPPYDIPERTPFWMFHRDQTRGLLAEAVGLWYKAIPRLYGQSPTTTCHPPAAE